MFGRGNRIFWGAAVDGRFGRSKCPIESRARRALLSSQRGRFVEVGGVRLHFLEQGSGTPLLLHGNGASVEDFTTSGLFGAAAARYRVLAFDRPGFGRSTRPPGRRWSAAAQADLIHAAAAKLGLDPYVVPGYSWGRTEGARGHPRSTGGTVLISG